MRQIRIAAMALAALVFGFVTTLGPVASADGTRVWPITGPVVRGFVPPEQTYGPGHRGIDIGGPVGADVVAPDDGVVTFVGSINYVPMVTLAHADGVKTTYQPVVATVRQGDSVARGQTIGVLQAGHGTPTADAPASLHFGVIQAGVYIDPLAWLGVGATIRLLPSGATLPPPPRASPLVTGVPGGWPVAGPITSPYGWRINPVSGVRSFHDGIDIGSPCGTPISAPWAGTVTQVGTSDVWGNYVRIAHDGGLQTFYAHLSAVDVDVGDVVQAGQRIGLVGTTGWSTGCHLHFGAARDGQSINPRPLLP